MKKAKTRKKNQKKIFFEKAAFISFRFFVVFFLIYSLTVLSLDPGFFSRDSKEKYAQAADTLVSVTIPGKPGKPVLSASTGCESGSPYVNLYWNTTSDTDSYDIDRDFLPLVTGILGLSYQDLSVQESSNYLYKLTASGPMGKTSSDEITATTSSDCESSVPAGCSIQTIGGKNVSSYGGTPKIKDRTPSFTGTSNIANAVISISVSGHPAINATTFANINGYWSWTVPEKLDFEKHTISVTAASPSNPAYYGIDSLIFNIKESEDEDNDDEDKKETSPYINEIQSTATATKKTGEASEESEIFQENTVAEKQSEIQAPVIYVKTESHSQEILAGEKLEFNVSVLKTISEKENFSAEYIILDEKNNTLASFSEDIAPSEKETKLKKDISIPKLASPGKYKIFVKISSPQFISTGEDYFFIKESPLLQFGGTVLTLSDIMKKISWLMLILFAFFLAFLALLAIEHHSASMALRQVTENLLFGKGLISKRKEVLS